MVALVLVSGAHQRVAAAEPDEIWTRTIVLALGFVYWTARPVPVGTTVVFAAAPAD